MKLYAEQPDSFSDRDAMIALDVISTGALDVRSARRTP